MGELYNEMVSFPNLYLSFTKAFKGKRGDPEAASFHLDLEKNLFEIRDELLNHCYRPGEYRYFKIYDPKVRTISEAPFRDRVVHHALINMIEPVFENMFIDNSFACRKGKGTHRAVLLAQKYLKMNPFYLKMDIEKYFDNIDHQKLLEMISAVIDDADIFWLLTTILKTSEQSSGIKGKGIPIGNLTSQFFGNVYLNRLDHYVLETLSRQYYLRYMDDFVIFADDKEKLKEERDTLNAFICKELLLTTKERAVILQRRENGIGFLGYRVFPRLIRIKNKNIRRLKRKIQVREHQYRSGRIDEARLAASVQSIMAYFDFADAAGLKRSIFKNGC
jgi:RNA-directed DNA polymerase